MQETITIIANGETTQIIKDYDQKKYFLKVEITEENYEKIKKKIEGKL